MSEQEQEQEPGKVIDLTYQHETGAVYGLGCQPPKHEGKLEAYESKFPILTRGQVIDLIRADKCSLKDWVFAILNQTSHPWCWEFAATQVLMVSLAQAGYEQVILDPTIGNLVTGETGGNAIDAMIVEVQSKFGHPDCAISGNDPVSGDVSPRRIPRNWKENAAKRIVPGSEWLRLHNMLQVASAIANSHPCCWGLSWQGGGHALACLEVGYDDKRDDLFYAAPNSWGSSFSSGWGSYPGRPGWYRLYERQISGVFDSSQFGAYALCGAKDTAVA